jgi:hypothetical protein
MTPIAFALALWMTQAPGASPETETDSAEAKDPTTPAAVPPQDAAPPSAPAVPPAPRNKLADEITSDLKRLQAASREERQKIMLELTRRYGDAGVNPVLPPSKLQLSEYASLSATDQGKVIARSFLLDVLHGDLRGLVAHSGLPFMMEGRRIDQPEALRAEWSRVLRTRRLDLLILYDIEVLAPADMEKKYGKPPSRLSAWAVRAPNTLLAVANLSGHSAVLLLRQVGLTWQVTGFHD